MKYRNYIALGALFVVLAVTYGLFYGTSFYTEEKAVLASSEETEAAPLVSQTASAGVFSSVKKSSLLNISTGVPTVPFYSQFADISSPKWQKLGCGIASLAMLIDFYNKESVSVDALLSEGIAAGAFVDGAGWAHAGLAHLAEAHGLSGHAYDYGTSDMDTAFARLAGSLEDGPVIASVHYTLDPANPIPHLVVVNGIEGDTVYYNDPSDPTGGSKISSDDFMRAWKKRYITVRASS